MTDSLRCKYCGCSPKHPKPEDVVSFLCGSCSMGAARLIDLQERKKYSQVTPKAVKSARKGCTPPFTQTDLDTWLDLPTNHTNRVENGHEIPCEKLFNFVKDFQDGKITKVPYTRRSKKTKKRRKKRG